MHGGNPSAASANIQADTYRIGAGSTAIGAAVNLTSLGIIALDTDAAGISRSTSGAWDIGAYQYVAPDTTPPSVPTGLSATAVSQDEIDLSWASSTDNVGVAGYDVYQNGTKVATTSVTTYADTGLAANTSYSYSVDAFDAASNVSGQSSSTSATTQSSSGGGGSGGEVAQPAAPVVSVPFSYAPGGGSYTPIPPASTSAAPTSSSTAIIISTSSLEAELVTLRAELAALLAQGAGQAGSASFIFPRNLSFGMTGNDVKDLQNLLIAHASGPAAAKLKVHGATRTFGILTYNALKEFQKKAGIVPASGYFGPKTRACVNASEK